MKDKPEILYLIQLPGPIHGVSLINSYVYESETINRGFSRILVEMRYSDTLPELRRFSIPKLITLVKIAFQLARRLARDKPDLVYFSLMPVGKGFFRDLILVIILKLKRARVVYHLHNRGMHGRHKNIIWRTFYRFTFNHSNIIHLTEGLLEEEIYPLGLKGARCYAVPNGTPPVKLPELRPGPQPGPPAGNVGINLLFLSNIFPEKGIFDLLDAMKEVCSRRKDIRLTIAGEYLRTRYEKELKRRIAEMHLEDYIALIGPKYDRQKFSTYAETDIFVFPSYFRQECLPLVVLEAMNCGIPVISTSVGVIPGIIRNEEEGFIVEPRDTSGFASAILSLAGDRQLRLRMGNAVREKYFSTYTLNSMENKIRMIIDDVLAGSD